MYYDIQYWHMPIIVMPERSRWDGGWIMSLELALNYYLGKNGSERMNCAQSVLKAFTAQFKVDADLVKLFGSYGRGNAPDGLCGAFYAVKYLSEKNSVINDFAEFEKHFVELAGSVKCAEIRAAKKISCLDCVKKCGAFLEKII
jgi:hypothetical protein